MEQQGQRGQGMMGQQRGRIGPGMMRQRGWRSDTKGFTSMGRGGMLRGMGHGGMMRIMFAVIDADGDGALSLDEVQEAHARIFNHVDADNDGQVTRVEMQAIFSGTSPVADADSMDDFDDADGMDE